MLFDLKYITKEIFQCIYGLNSIKKKTVKWNLNLYFKRNMHDVLEKVIIEYIRISNIIMYGGTYTLTLQFISQELNYRL